MRALWLVVLLSVPAFAQVAGLCGNGRPCSVYSLRATAPVNTNAITLATTGAKLCLSSACAGYLTSDSVSSYAVWFYSTNQLRVWADVVQTTSYMLSSNGYAAPVAFASFPAAAAGNAGRLLYDSTSAVWRISDGATWKKMVTNTTGTDAQGAAGAAWNAWSGVPGTPATEGDNFFGPFFTKSMTPDVTRLACNWAVAGTGGATGVVVEVYDTTGAAQACQCTLGACTTAARVPLTCECLATLATTSTYVMRLHTNTDCDINPEQIVCNATISPP